LEYVLAIDQGTTGTTVMLFDREGRTVDRRYRELTQHFPRPGWVEHDAEEIWEHVRELIAETARAWSLSPSNLRALGITNQRETVVLWDRKTGRPLHRAIVWQCRRTAERCRSLKDQGLEAKIHEKTGLYLDPYFSGSKIEWLLDHVDGARDAARRGDLACGTIDSWLIWNLTGGLVHATDATNASRTLLFDIRSLKWDDELLELFRVPAGILPEVRPNVGRFGATRGVAGFPDGIPISGCAGDQQAALFGQACFEPGMVKNTYGTGAFLLMNSGGTPPATRGSGLLATLAWAIGSLDRPVYAAEGSVFVAGAVVQWLRDGLGLIKSAAETEALATSVPDNGGVYFVPAFVGLGAPEWDPFARGLIAGLTRGTKKEHLVRAALESIAFQSRDVIEAMRKATGSDLEGVRIDGGASANNFLAQFQADILGTSVERPQMVETTAMGAAFMAGLAEGVWSSLDEIKVIWRSDRVFTARMSQSEREALVASWRRAVERAKGWAVEG